ncbi:MAG: hypothetical protein AMS15_04795 [Planctomycetes bacterium DG_23]|nr:MAG: hypothetical protein AMS15_04795 [Planctomycetes bacterium DG_23]
MRNFLRHKGLYIFLSISLLILLTILAGLLLLGHRPSFYKDYSSLPQEELQNRAGHFLQHLLEVASLANQGEEFQLEIQEDELNCFLAANAWQDLPGAADYLPFSGGSPQVHFLPPQSSQKELGKIILAVKLGILPLDTVISAHCRLSKMAQGFVIEVDELKAGALPIPRRFFKSAISEVERVRLENVFEEVEIEDLRLEKGWLRIVGRGRPDKE